NLTSRRGIIMFELAREPSDIGRIIDSGIKLYTGSLKSVFVLALVATFVIYIPEFLAGFLVSNEEGADNTLMWIMLLVLFGLLTLLYFALYSALILKIWACARQEAAEIQQLVERGFALLLPVVIGSILFFFAVVFGMLLLILPGIYLTVALSFYYFAIVIEDRGPVASLKRSLQIIRGHWWRTLFIMLIPTIIAMVFFMVVGIIAGMLGFLAAGFSDEGLAFQVTMDVILNIAQAFVIPFFISLMLVLYNDLVLRLDAKVEVLEQEQNPVVRR
ncbi:MAG: hypothetical protein MI673_07755, partial [Thiotrichales bacterium]|nr:hypothetical protein [Thiotrichales bacterium]